MSEGAEKFESWALVEMLGHVRAAGHLTAQVVAGTSFLRLDIPECRNAQGEVVVEPWTKFIGGGSVYSFTPLSEGVARRLATMLQHKPVHEYDLATPARATPRIERDIDDDDDHPF